MARLRTALLFLFALSCTTAVLADSDKWRNQVKKYFRDSLDSIDVGSAPGGGADFQMVSAEDMEADGDGVLSLGCLNMWMRKAMQVNINLGGPNPVNYCPFGPYGAAIVDAYDRSATNEFVDGHNCGKLLETNSGIREVNLHNPAAHSEINAIARLTDCNLHPADCDANGNYRNAQNKTFWQRLYLFTTAASCPADAASETLAGFKKIVQAVTVKDLLKWNWTQDSFLEPQVIYASSRQNNGVNTLITDVERDWMKQYFNWQFTNVAHGCPTGCSVSTDANTGARTCVTSQ